MPAGEEGEAVSELGTAGHWSTELSTWNVTWQGAQVGSINGHTLSVGAGSCGDGCGFAPDRTDISSAELINGSFNNQEWPDNLSTHDKVSLAPFNGYLYMVHIGGNDDDSHKNWITKYNPANPPWEPDQPMDPIDYPSNVGPPAIVAYNNKLYFIGNKADGSMWYGTMDTNGTFSSTTTIPFHQTTGRINATVAFGQIFYSHRNGTSTDLVYGTFNGSTWSQQPYYIYGGTNHGPLQGTEAALAFDGSRLHLTHVRPNDTFVWWTQYDNCNWSSLESQIGGIRSDLDPSLAVGGPGLVMMTDHRDGGYYNVKYATWTPPSMPSRCLVIGH